MYPLILFISAVSIGALLFSNYVLPVANLKFYSLLFDVRSQRPEINIKPGIFYNGIDDFSIRVQKKDDKTSMLYGVMIYDHRMRYGNTDLTIADSGKILMTTDKRYILLTLYNGEKYQEVREGTNNKWMMTHPSQKDRFEEENITIELSGFGFARSEEGLFKEHYHMLNIFQLQATQDSLETVYNDRKKEYRRTVAEAAFYKKIETDSVSEQKHKNDTIVSPDMVFKTLNLSEKQKVLENALYIARNQKTYISGTYDDLSARESWIVKHKIEFHMKFTLAFACLILFFIGAPLGAIIRKGGLGMPVVVSVLFFIFYYIVSLTGEKFAKELIIPAWQGIWLSSFILFPIGLFLTYKAATDSTLFNIDAYYEPFRKFANKVLKKKVKSNMVNNESTPVT